MGTGRHDLLRPVLVCDSNNPQLELVLRHAFLPTPYSFMSYLKAFKAFNFSERINTHKRL
jgi:hypothetical protein